MQAADEQAAVAASLDGQLFAAGPAVGDQPLGRRDEVVKHVLFLKFGSGLVPRLAVFTATAQIGHRQHSAHFQPCQSANAE
jgi:plasmid stabilization system protein ParE